MSIRLNDNLKIVAPKPSDWRYGPWQTLTEALNALDKNSMRYEGQTVRIGSGTSAKEYWFKDGVDDPDLVEKTQGSTVTGGLDRPAGYNAVDNLPALQDGTVPTTNFYVVQNADATNGTSIDLGVAGTPNTMTVYPGDSLVYDNNDQWIKLDTSVGLNDWSAILNKPNLFGPSAAPGVARPQIGDILNLQTTLVEVEQYKPSVSDTVPSANTVGAIQSGTLASELSGLTISQILDMALFPTVDAYIQRDAGATLQASIDGAGGSTVIEVGEQVNITLSATLDQGLIRNGDGTNAGAVIGSALQYTYSGPQISGTIVTATQSSGIPYQPTDDGVDTWLVEISHDQGSSPYYDNKGQTQTNLDSQRVSGTKSDTSNGIRVVFPWFHGDIGDPANLNASVIEGVSTNNRHAERSLNKVYVGFSNLSAYHWAAFPASGQSSSPKTKWGEKDSAFNKGDIGPGNAFEFFGSVTLNINGISQAYNVYITGNATTFSKDMYFE